MNHMGHQQTNGPAHVATDGWRVLVVDDSIVVRAAVRVMLASMPEVASVATAPSASAALGILAAQARTAPLDVVLLDVEMPSMTGIEALPHLLEVSPTTRVVMASSLTRRGAAVTMAALAAGASDYICKPSASAGGGEGAFQNELAAKIVIWAAHARRGRVVRPDQPAASPLKTRQTTVSPAQATLYPGRTTAASAASSPPRPERPCTKITSDRRFAGIGSSAPRPFKALAIGSSTGGPQALMQLFTYLKAPPGCPVFVTQHMPKAFTAMLAEQIGRLTGGACREAIDGEPAIAGRIYVAPGDSHLLVNADPGQPPRLRLSEGAPENFCRPAVDPMLRSLAAVYRDGLCAVILTGMGQDGLIGCQMVKEHGGQVIVQDEATSVVWGMPGAVARNGLADHVVPIPEIATILLPCLGQPCSRAT